MNALLSDCHVARVPAEIAALCIQYHAVGSRVTCNPPPMDTDADFLLLVDEQHADRIRSEVMTGGFELDGSDLSDVVLNTPEDHQFNSYSDGEVNLIITASPTFFRRFMAATSVAKRLNLLDKADRIALFQAVLYGNQFDQAEAV